MPNYSLVANTVFQNRNFDDLLRPLAMYTEEYRNLENSINELDTQASIWEGMADEERDPIAYAQYKRYADDLRSQAALLGNSGLNPTTRRNILNLKRRYASEIVPIEQAFTNRKAQADEQRKALLQDPTLLLSRRADATSLDAYLDNPQLGYDSYSGALLTSQVGTAASALAKELRDYGNGKPLDAYTNTWLKEHGFTAAQVAQAINNPDHPDSSRVLSTLVNNVVADSGVPKWGDRSTIRQAYDYANQGLWQAIGQTDVATYDNYGSRMALQLANAKALADYKATQDLDGAKHAYIPPYALRSTRDIEESQNRKEKVNKFIEKGWLTVNEGGSYGLSGPGLRALRVGYEHKDDKTPRVVDTEGRFLGRNSMENIPEQYSDQKEFMHLLDDLSNGSLFDDNGHFKLDMSDSSGNVDKLIHTLDEGSYDIWRTTEWGWHPTPEQGKSIMRNVIAASGKSGLREVDFQVDKDGNGSFKDVKKLDFTAPEIEKMSVDNVMSTSAGITIIGVLGDDTYRIHVPRGTGGEGLTDNLMIASDERTKAAMIINSIENKPQNQITKQDLQDYNTAKKRYYDLGDIMAQYAAALSLESQAQPQQITVQGR